MCLAINGRIISSIGLEIETTLSPLDGLNFAKSHWYELSGVVCDQIMPQMQGTELVEKLREWESQTGKCQMPVIILSGVSNSAFKQSAFDAGVTDVLVKPVTRE